MQLQFERGSADRPRGHALLYLRSAADPDAVLATYVVVLPVPVDLARYIPPMFAGDLASTGASKVSAIPWPPIPEPLPGHAHVARLAAARDDDLVFGGVVDAARPELLLQLTSEAAQAYAELYARGQPAPEAAPSEGALPELDVDEVLYGLMSDRDRLTDLVKRTGSLRDAVEAGERLRIEAAAADLQRLARHFPEKYRLTEFVETARQPGERARRLTELYVERCYRVCNEDYAGLQQLDEQIQALS